MADERVCLLKLDGLGGIEGWLMADDPHDLRRILDERSWQDPAYPDIARQIYVREIWPAGKHVLAPNYILLVGAG